MSLYTPWAPSSLSPSQRSNMVDPSFVRDPFWHEERGTGLVKLAVSLGNFDRHPVHSSNLPGFRDLYPAKRLPPLASLSLASTLPSDPSFHCHSYQKANRLPTILQPMASLSPPHSASRLSAHAPHGFPHFSAGNFHNQIGHSPPQAVRARDDVSNLSLTPSPPNFYTVPSYSLPTGQLPRRSKAAIAAEDWDHPSFARPPHKAVEPKAKITTAFWEQVNPGTTDEPLFPEPSAVSADELEPMVPESYPVPPPPPFEKSAAPFADLASEMVWERCFLLKTRVPSLSPTFSDSAWESPFSWNANQGPSLGIRARNHRNSYAQSLLSSNFTSSDWRRPADMFGVIGAEAKARKFYRGTQPSDSWSLSPPNLNESRKSGYGARMEVKPAFRRWTRQVLEQTLLSPQVLVLALYYVDVVAGTDVFGDNNSKASLLPYKILLASLVLANKTLDDHSYKNSTFANVSSMTNAEVNTIEVALLKALNFNLVPSAEQWYHWLDEVSGVSERAGCSLVEACFHSAQCNSGSNWFSKPHSEGFPSQNLNQQSIFDRSNTPPTFQPLGDWSGGANTAGFVPPLHYHQEFPQNYWQFEGNRPQAVFQHYSDRKPETFMESHRGFGAPGTGFTSQPSYSVKPYPIFG